MHIAIEGLDGVGKTCTAKCLAEKLGFDFLENPIYELVGRIGVKRFKEHTSQIDEDFYRNVAALFYGAGNLYLNHQKNEKDIITDRHLCATYLWNATQINLQFFDFLVDVCGQPDLTILLYAKPDIRRQRIMHRDPNDPDLQENIFTDEKYEKALDFVKRYNMKYLWLDNSEITICQTVDKIISYINETLTFQLC